MLPFTRSIKIPTEGDICEELDPPLSTKHREIIIERIVKYYKDGQYAENLQNVLSAFINAVPIDFIQENSDYLKTLPAFPPMSRLDRSSLYRSIAVLVFGFEWNKKHGYNYWSLIHQVIYEHMKSKTKIFDFVCNRFGETSVNEYIKRCLEDKTYINEEIELRALSHLFNVTIYIFTEDDLENCRRPTIVKPHNVFEYKGSGIRFEQPTYGIHLFFDRKTLYEPIVAFNSVCFSMEPNAFMRRRTISGGNDLGSNDNVSANKTSSYSGEMTKTLFNTETEKMEVNSIPNKINHEDKERLLQVAYGGQAELYQYKHFPDIIDDSNFFETYLITIDESTFFRSIAYLLTGRETLHEPIRKVLYRYMADETNQKTMDWICVKFGITFSIKAYLQTRNIGNPCENVHEVEIHAMSVMLNSQIGVFDESRVLTIYRPKTEDVCPRMLAVQRVNNNFKPVTKYNRSGMYNDTSKSQLYDSFGSISSLDLINMDIGSPDVCNLADDLMMSDSEDELKPNELEPVKLLPYTYDPVNQLDDKEIYTVVVHGASGSKQEKTEWASKLVFRKNEQDTSQSDNDEIELHHEDLNEKEILKVNGLMKLTSMINRFFAITPVTLNIFAHFQEVTSQSSISELKNCHPTDERIKRHLRKTIDMRLGLERFKGFSTTTTGEKIGDSALTYACLAIDDSLEDTKFAYYHTGGIGGSWKPIAVNKEVFKKGDNCFSPRQTVVMNNNILFVGLGYLCVTDLFGSQKRKIIGIPEVRDTHIKLLLGRTLKGQVYILDITHRRCIEVTQEYDMRWTNVQTLEKDKISYLPNQKSDVYLIEMSGNGEAIYVFIPKPQTESEVYLTDIQWRNSSIPINEFVISLIQPGNYFNVSKERLSTKNIRMYAYNANPDTKYILVDALHLNNHIEKLRKVKKPSLFGKREK